MDLAFTRSQKLSPRVRLFWLGHAFRRWRTEGIANWAANHLPKRVVYFAVIRLWAYGTMGQYGNTHPDELTWSDALDRWEGRDGTESDRKTA